MPDAHENPRLERHASRTVAALVPTLVLLACSAAAPSRGEPPPFEAGAPGEDSQDFMEALAVRRAEVELAGTVTQPALSGEGGRVLVDGRAIEVFEYATKEDARVAASEISPDGLRVGETVMGWTAPPHWFQHGRLLVLYLGTDRDLLMLLQDVLGHQIAGANSLPGG